MRPDAASPTTPHSGRARAPSTVGSGLAWGFLGIVSFSASLPTARLATLHLDPWFVSLGRALVAGTLAALLLLWRRPRLPAGTEWRSLALVVVGVVLGFPVLSTLALRDMPAAHASVIVGTAPLLTAAVAALIARERHGLAFWLASVAGCALVVGFALWRAGGAGVSLGLAPGDALMLLAVVAVAFGYVGGGKAARTLGGWQTICWALLLALPLLPLPVWWTRPAGPVPAASWAAFGYQSLVSMFLGFFAWYRGLALGGIARVGQVQLLQPFLSLGLSALLLGEAVPPTLWLVAAAVVACVFAARRAA
jgi:drug/metabolite transporter (DMT)-like permease